MSSTREKELARQRAERQAARRAAAAARKRQRAAVIGSVVAVLLVAAGLGVLTTVLSGGDDTAPTSVAQPAASEAAAPGQCAYPEAGTAAKPVELPPVEGVETDGVFTATMVTSEGTIAFEMDAAAAPCTVNNLRSLAHFTYFDDTPCHRLVTEGIYVLQCGDPTGTGTGGPGYRFDNENLEGATYPRGTVAMANSGPGGTNGSQFFLVYQDSPLPAEYTPFGTITEGLDVLDAIAEGGAEPSPDGSPVIPVQIDTLRTGAKA